VIAQIDGEFAELLRHAQDKFDCHDSFSQLPQIRKQLRESLAQQEEQRMLSLEGARNKAQQLLEQWVSGKQQALIASQESRHASVANVLIQLTLNEPWLGKAQVASFRDTIEQSVADAYAAHRPVYEALQIDKKKLCALLHRPAASDALFSHLSDLVRQTHKASAAFDDSGWSPPDIKAMLQNHNAALTQPLVDSYAKVAALKGKVPPHIYQTMLRRVAEGANWAPQFIAAANALHSATLIHKDGRGLYALLDSPPVARKRIGSREDFVSFTLEDLLLSMLGPKNINNPKKRRKAIDVIVPQALKDELLNELEQQLLKVQSRVMNADDANALFERGALRFLRAQNINFEATVAKK